MILLQANYDWWKQKVLLIPFLIFIILPRLLSAVTSAISKISIDLFGVPDVSFLIIAISILAWDRVLLVLGTMLSVLFSGESIKLKKLGITQWTIRATVFQILNEFAYFMAFSLGSYLVVTTVRRLDILISAIFGGKLFQEKRLVRNISASFIMFAGALIIIIGRKYK